MSAEDALGPFAPHSNKPGFKYGIEGSWASTAFGEPRFTNDVDILAEFTQENLTRFLSNLPDTFYVDVEEALTAIRSGRSFTPFTCRWCSSSISKLGIRDLLEKAAKES